MDYAASQKSTQTFQSLGMPFPLFTAPIAHANLDEAGPCALCQAYAAFRFQDKLCYSCLSTVGCNAMNSELGLIWRDSAELGRTFGLPLYKMGTPPDVTGYRVEPAPFDPRLDDVEYYFIYVDKEYLLQLLRTPQFTTWQGASWLFCCQRPMVFRGGFPDNLLAGDDDERLRTIEKFLAAPRWSKTIGTAYEWHMTYAFTCTHCGKLRYYDECC